MGKIKIAIIELETHTQVIKQWDFLLRNSEVIDVDYFLHSKLKVNLSFLNPENSSYCDFNANSELEGFLSEIPKYDLVIINTLHRHFEAYAKLFATQKTLCIVHNPNFSLFHKPISIRNLWDEKSNAFYFLKLFLIEKIRKYQNILFKADFFGVFSSSIYDEIIKEGTVSEKKLVNISLTYTESVSFEKKLPINIVISGTVSEKRKDYETVFEMIKKLNPQHPIVFYFLGRPENSKMEKKLEELSKLEIKNLEVVHYKKLIPSSEFDKIIQNSHILLCPVKVKTSFYGVTEFYGKTKISGNEYDCVRNGKIGLFPTSYPKMNWHNLYYQNGNDLAEMLNNLTLENLEFEYQKLQPYIQNYTFENVKNQLENQLLQLANTK
ncbi:hypothetical protein [Flavobacterium sp.]|uniref:hypothetical protein n=1 Tax=Flavobacterium sp. TaxID=239 RepID=UPI00261DD625|nr:hypothetical protein [Flavobacterium sp.]